MPRYPERAHRKSKTETTVYHVGGKPVPGGRTSRAFSQEGGELSVSEHPDEWADIARLGDEVWQLRKAGARFLRVPGHKLPRATAWAVRHGYVELATVDRFGSLGEEAAGYRFGSLGEAYWRANFDDPVDHGWAEAFAPIFYARAHGYDGVWYDERYDPSDLSCPRGLILQEKLPEWTVRKR